ncbi:serine protease [Actinosynnema sp. NPDC050436]|uniref:S1 family peptidase n=1 Tax=Actinosynnema sp. NPDC050436 TaxID=3155659 RepID=UPI0033D2A40D
MRAVLVALVLALVGGGAASADPRVVGGSRVSIGDFPWVVYLADSSGKQFCGGTLVAPAKVLTAAHCTTGLAPRIATVVVGREDRNDARSGEALPVARVWTHPEYRSADQGSDVAVVTLARATSATPLPLADDPALYEAGTPATALGWGRTSEQGATSRYLLGVAVPVVSSESCATAYGLFKPESMVCAGVPEGGRDTCQGDSGGPLAAGGKLIGVTSWGEGCARRGKPGVYAKVMTYRKVIEEQINATG